MAHSKNIVLIVDDDQTGFQMLFEHLQEAGFAVLIAPHAEAAFESIKDTLPDIILLDVTLPGIDGFTLAARLKADEATRDIPIIFMATVIDV